MERSPRGWFGFGASACALVTLMACGGKPLNPRRGDAGADAPADADAPNDAGGDAPTEVSDDATTEVSNDATADTSGADAGVDLPGVVPIGTCSSVTPQGWEAIPLGPVTPLFTVTDAKNPPIVFRRDDGVLVTRAAGRFRGRHEKEPTFGTYYRDTFLDSGFGLVFEDFTPLGQQRIRVSYLPAYKPINDGNRQTNFRHWKIQGNNNTFAFNDYLAKVTTPPITPTAPIGGVEQFDELRSPADRTLAAGEIYDIEFGAFMPPSIPWRRDSFYTDTFRYRIGVGGLTPNNRDYEPLAGPLPGAQLGGDTTLAWLVAEPHLYFEQMALNTQHENVQNFLDGRRLFFTDFTTGAHLEEGNTDFTEQAGKAGPLFNARSCETCHVRNGAGSWADGALGEKSSVAIKLYDAGPLGGQLQPQEGTAAVAGMDTKTVVLSDGMSVALHKPKVGLAVTGGGAPRFSVRIARPLVGLGLLEAIDERRLLALADRGDCESDGISGRPSIVKDPLTGAFRVGRFGWKAEKVSVAHQVAADASESLGVTTSIVPEAQRKEELTDVDLAKLTTYMRLIGVPPQRKSEDPQVRSGAQVFLTIGCAACHRTELTTSPIHPFSELRNQTIKPFTDLLLHDMGPDLADDSGIPTAAVGDDAAPASASEWRTPPLWGVGLAKIVNPAATFLHDGRAANLQEAILWHGGEAERSKNLFVGLSAADRAALLAFVESL